MIKATVKRVDVNPQRPDMSEDSRHFRVTLKNTYTDKRASFFISQGPLAYKDPTARSALNCLLADAAYAETSFEDFRSDCGYGTDSRKAERSHRIIQRNTKRLATILGGIPKGDPRAIAFTLTED